MEQTRVFYSNRSQAVRLPKAVALPEDVKDVDVIALGRARLIVPHGEGWDSWFDGPGVTPDFMAAREQPEPQERDSISDDASRASDVSGGHSPARPRT